MCSFGAGGRGTASPPTFYPFESAAPAARRHRRSGVAVSLACGGRPGSEQVKIYRRINVVIHQKCTKSELLDHKTGLNRFKPVWATV